MPLPPFNEFLAWVDENAGDIFQPPHMDVIQFPWPIEKPEFNALLKKIEENAIQYSLNWTSQYLLAYHRWISEHL